MMPGGGVSRIIANNEVTGRSTVPTSVRRKLYVEVAHERRRPQLCDLCNGNTYTQFTVQRESITIQCCTSSNGRIVMRTSEWDEGYGR